MTGTVEVDGAAFEAMFGVKAKRTTLEIVVTRADGTVEDLGIVADSGDLTEPAPPTLAQRFRAFFSRRKD